MTNLEAIVELRERINRNNTNDKIDVDYNRAISLLNDSQLRYVKIINKSNDDVREIQFLLKSKQLELKRENSEFALFNKPTDFFDLSYLDIIASQGKCQDKMLTWEIKTPNKSEIEFDSSNKPSFYYRETFYNLEGNFVKIYLNNFTIKKATLNYYRSPRIIDIQGRVKLDGTMSLNSHPEFSDYSMSKIIDLAVINFNLNVENLQRYNVDSDKFNRQK